MEHEKVSAVSFRPEVELLLCCARTHLDSERASRIKALLRGKPHHWACHYPNFCTKCILPKTGHLKSFIGDHRTFARHALPPMCS
jgi:hypothetical protein